MRIKNVPIRLILLKARQWGGSTLIQMYMLWIQIVHKKNWNSVICAHIMDSAKTIREMYNNCLNGMMPIEGVKHELSSFGQTMNIKEVKTRGCRITVGSANEPESVRSQDIKMVHFSEAAYYPSSELLNGKKLVASIISSIPAIPYTIVALESTGNGVGDFFNMEYVKAASGQSPYRAVFVSWFELGDLYAIGFNSPHPRPLSKRRGGKDRTCYYNHSGVLIEGSVLEFVDTMSDWEKQMFENNGSLTLEHLNGYRYKNSELGEDMKKEFPSDDMEAFVNTGEAVFNAYDIEALRLGCEKNPVAVGVMTSRGDAATIKITRDSPRSLTEEVRFVEQPELLKYTLRNAEVNISERKLNNKLVIWSYPDRDIEVSNRYVVVFDPARGVTNSADWGTICVIDRYWTRYGGKPEIVAEWRGHIENDIAAWIAVQISIYYNNALLVVESNTFDSTYKKEDYNEFIFEIIADYYGNLYSRVEPDKVKEGMAVRYGFHTNRNTKPAIIADYVSTLRERAYIEHSHRTLDQARVYERKPDGSYGAKTGYHDDDIITRMIGLYISYHEMPLPETIEKINKSYSRYPVSEAVI
jgi:hypothetical protein